MTYTKTFYKLNALTTVIQWLPYSAVI